MLQIFGGKALEAGGTAEALMGLVAESAGVYTPDINDINESSTNFQDFIDIFDNFLVHSRKDIKDVFFRYAKAKPKEDFDSFNKSKAARDPVESGRLLSYQECTVLSVLCVESNNTGLKRQFMSMQVRNDHISSS